MAARTQFSVSTMNLYNLNRPGLPVYSDRDGWSDAEYAAKIAWTGRQIADQASDVWGLQELWHEGRTARGFRGLRMTDRYTLLVPPGHAGGGSSVPVRCGPTFWSARRNGSPISRWISAWTASGDDPQTRRSPSGQRLFPPRAAFQVPRGRTARRSMSMSATSNPRPRPRSGAKAGNQGGLFPPRQRDRQGLSTIRRTAEATALRMMVTEMTKNTDTPVMVLGDVNDGHHSNTLDILTAQPNYLLSGLSEGGGDTGLYTVWSLQLFRSDATSTTPISIRKRAKAWTISWSARSSTTTRKSGNGRSRARGGQRSPERRGPQGAWIDRPRRGAGAVRIPATAEMLSAALPALIARAARPARRSALD